MKKVVIKRLFGFWGIDEGSINRRNYSPHIVCVMLLTKTAVQLRQSVAVIIIFYLRKSAYCIKRKKLNRIVQRSKRKLAAERIAV